MAEWEGPSIPLDEFDEVRRSKEDKPNGYDLWADLHYKKPVFLVLSPIMSACFWDVFELASNVPVNGRMSMRK